MKKRRLLSIVLSLCMVLALMPQMVFAADPATNVPYLDASGAQHTCDSATVVNGVDTTWGTDGQTTWYVVQGNVLISSITVNGDIHLILADGCSLTVNGNISGGSLNIYGQYGGTGKLAVSGNIISGNGVDGSNDPDNSSNGGSGGNIAINGGTINAGSIAGANGGRGGYWSKGGNGGSITIRGGVVKTDSIAGGNGGQGGFCEYDRVTDGGNGGNITISGGIVEADSITSGNGGKGNATTDAMNIGKYGKDGDNGIIDINGGIVFQGSSGQVYGKSFTLSETLIIPAGKTLTIPADKTLINNGTIYVDGTLTGSVDDSSTGSIYYLLTLEGATASGFDSTYNEKTYAKAGSNITLTPENPQAGYKFAGWDVSSSSTVSIGEDNTFTMPAATLTVTARYKDIEKPVISGVKDGKTYCSAQTVTVSDNDAIEKVTVNEVVVTLDEHNQFTRYPASGKQEIIATDKTGNSTKVTVTINDGHTYGAWKSKGNGTHIRYCTVDGCDGYEDGKCTGGEATCTAKAECEYCGEEYGELDSSNHSLENIHAKDATVTATGNIEYWQCENCDKYFSDENGENEITLDETVISKLPPKIIKGEGQSITAGEKKALSFTSNAAFSDFIRVELDGKTLNQEYYEKAEGSIIITLDADYVATLPAGEHTIGIVSESGTATTTFTVAEKAASGTSDDSDKDSKSDEDSAKTGDNTNLALWLALMLLSGAGITGVTAYTRRKRTNE